MSFQQNDLPQAEAAAEHYVRASENLAAAHRVQGFVRMRLGNYAGGTEAFEQALRLEPEEPQNALLVAEAYRTLGRAKEACDLLRSAKGTNQNQNSLFDGALRACAQP
jgi:tetratricopeptide (TPR) repeat protein